MIRIISTNVTNPSKQYGGAVRASVSFELKCDTEQEQAGALDSLEGEWAKAMKIVNQAIAKAMLSQLPPEKDEEAKP